MARDRLAKDEGKSLKRGEENPFLSLKKEMDRLFDDFWRGFPSLEAIPGGAGTFTPCIDVTDTEDELTITAEMPGMDEKDIEVTLTRDVLTIKGEKKEEKEERGGDFYHMERSYGSFVRTVPLPVEVDAAGVEASLKKGVLTVRLPKTAKAVKEAKKIAVTTA